MGPFPIRDALLPTHWESSRRMLSESLVVVLQETLLASLRPDSSFKSLTCPASSDRQF